MTYITVVPAYGRDYRSAKAALADWQAGKDFRHAATGQYLSSRDDLGSSIKVIIRYARLTKTTII